MNISDTLLAVAAVLTVISGLAFIAAYFKSSYAASQMKIAQQTINLKDEYAKSLEDKFNNLQKDHSDALQRISSLETEVRNLRDIPLPAISQALIELMQSQKNLSAVIAQCHQDTAELIKMHSEEVDKMTGEIISAINTGGRRKND